MVDINRDKECSCGRCKVQGELTAYIHGMVRNNVPRQFNAEFMPLLELLSASTAPLMTLLEAINSHQLNPEENTGAIDMAGLALMQLSNELDTLILNAGCCTIESQHNNLTNSDGNQSCDDWDL